MCTFYAKKEHPYFSTVLWSNKCPKMAQTDISKYPINKTYNILEIKFLCISAFKFAFIGKINLLQTPIKLIFYLYLHNMLVAILQKNHTIQAILSASIFNINDSILK